MSMSTSTKWRLRLISLYKMRECVGGCVCQYVCIYMCVYCMYVCMCVYIVCMYVCVYVCVCVYIYITQHTHTHKPPNRHTLIYKQAHTTHTRHVHSLLQQNAGHRTLICCHFFPPRPSSKQLLSLGQKAPLSKRFLAEAAHQVISVYRAFTEPE